MHDPRLEARIHDIVIDDATAWRMARLRTLRAARSSWQEPTFVHRHAAILTVVGVVAVLIALMVGVFVLARDPDERAWAMIPGFAALFVVIFVTTVLTTPGDSMRTAARQLRGRLDYEQGARLAWFDRHWVGELAPSDVHRSAGGCSITLIAHGYPVMLVLDPRALWGMRKPRLELFLAASFPHPPAPHGHPWIAEAWQWFAREGFELRWSEAGLRATARRFRLETLNERVGDGGPDQAELDEEKARGLFTVVHALVSTAALLGARPVGPLTLP